MSKAAELREQALELTRAQSTEALKEAFKATDALMDACQDDGDQDGYMAVATARGFLIDVLDERGECEALMADA